MIDIKKIFQDRRKGLNVGIPSFNINAMSASLEKKKALAEAALAKTTYGKGGVIRVDIDRQANKIIYIQTITGEIADTIEGASELAEEVSVSDVRIFGTRKSFGPAGRLASAMERAEALKNQYGAGAVLGESILDKLRNLDESKKEILRNNGIDIDNLSDFELRVYTMTKQETVGNLVNKIKTLQKSGTINGIIMPDDEGARILGFVSNGVSLNTYQTNLILDVTGHGFFDQMDMMEALASTEPGKAGAKLAKMVEKSPKRARALISSNEVSLSGEALESVVNKFKRGTRAIEDITLVLDPQYEILRKFANRNYNFDDLENSKGLKAYYRNFNALTEVRNINSSFELGDQLTDNELSELAGHIRSFTKNANDNTWASEQLMSHLKSNFIGTDSRKGAAVKGIFESIEKSYDGSDALNKRFIDTYVSSLQQQVRQIDAQLGSTSDAHQKQMALAMKEELTDKISRIRNGDFTQVTGRGRTGAFGGKSLNIKNAFGAPGEFKAGLEDFGMIVSKFSLKPEVGLGGDVSSFILGGIGQKGKTVYADPVSLMFNAQIFTNPKSLEIIQKNQTEIIEEFNQVLESGIIPASMRRNLEMQASMNIDELSVGKRLSGAANKEYAQAILDLLNSGASVKDNPRLLSMLHTAYAKRAFTEKQYSNGVSFFEPALPETHRFALTTERFLQAYEENQDIYKKLGESSRSGRYGYQSVEFANGVSADVVKFRIQGHAALLPNAAPGQFYHSLGGFDLDDKGLVRTVTYKDAQGNNRLGTYMFRQPSGPQEIIFMKANMDVDTIRSLFGNDIYRTELQSMIEAQAQTVQGMESAIQATSGSARVNAEATLRRANEALENLQLAQSIIREKNPLSSSTNLIGDKVEYIFAEAAQRIGNAYQLSDEAIEAIGTEGSSALKLSSLIDPATGKPIIPKYTKPGVMKVFLENGAFEMNDDILNVVNSNNVDAGLRQALNQPGLTFDEMIEILNAHGANAGEETRSVISTALNNMMARRLEQANTSPGSYVNRSGMATSVLDQYKAFMDLASDDVKRYLLDENNINYRIMMIPQESAIDLTVNVSTAKTVQVNMTQLIEQNIGTLNERGVAKSIAEVYQISKAGEEINLEKLGASAIASLGRLMGFTRAIGSTDQSTILGLDKFLVEGKLSAKDAELMVQESIAGMEDALKGVSEGRFSAIRDRADIEADLARYRRALNEGDDAIGRLVSSEIALDENHKFATLSKANKIAQNSSLSFSRAAKGGYGRIATDPILATARTTREEDALANFIIKKHSKSLAEANALTAKMMKELTDADIANHNARLMAIGEEILNDIGRAAQTRGVARRGLFDALDQATSKLGFDIASLRYVSGAVGYDEASNNAYQISMQMMANKELRRIQYYNSMNSPFAEQFFNTADIDEIASGNESLRSVSQRMIEDLQSGTVIDTNQENILKVLADQGNEISDPAQRRFANLHAQIIQSRVDEATRQINGFKDASSGGTITADEMRDLLDSKGTIDTVDDAFGATDDGKVIRDMLRSVTPDDDGSLPAIYNKAKYERLSKEAFQEGGKFHGLVTNPLVRKGAAGLGALIVGSFAYSAFKDRSNDDVEGPPLLPGGSAYEGNFPSRAPEIGDFAGQGYSPGVNYKVSLYGNRKAIQQFTNEAGGLVNGNIDTTMYNRISSMKQDPYSALASSY